MLSVQCNVRRHRRSRRLPSYIWDHSDCTHNFRRLFTVTEQYLFAPIALLLPSSRLETVSWTFSLQGKFFGSRLSLGATAIAVFSLVGFGPSRRWFGGSWRRREITSVYSGATSRARSRLWRRSLLTRLGSNRVRLLSPGARRVDSRSFAS